MPGSGARIVPTLPGMTHFAVELPALAQSAAGARAAGADLGTELDRLRAEADAVLSGQWLGRAAASFDRAWTAWHAGARDMIAALDELAAQVTACEREYYRSDGTASDGLRLAAS
jgi:WXG100 family type VII secretion target